MNLNNIGTSVLHFITISVRESARYSTYISVSDPVFNFIHNSVPDSVWDSVRNSAWVSVTDFIYDSVRSKYES
jgi:hypothetical protein